MMLVSFRTLASASVLGMNRRNADVILPRNPRSRFPLVDNKLLTKKLASAWGIPVPFLYHVIERHDDVSGLEDALGEINQFVVKPARGSGGSGILLVTDLDPQGFVTQSGATIDRADFAYYVSDILSGVYSLEGLEDAAIVEALVHPDPVFAAVTYQGVPDVRVIVYLGVPVMAMVRLPTRASDGKANLHRGAIGAGVEMGGGLTMTAVHGSRVATHHPDTGNPVSGIRVPHWEHILAIAAQTCEMTGLGYIGVDFVIDRDRGPVLLELNARPGLAIQLANRAGLLGRLRLVDARSHRPGSPEERVAWARETFGGLSDD